MFAGASATMLPRETGARSMTSFSSERRRVTVKTPLLRNRRSMASSPTQACIGDRSGLPAATAPVWVTLLFATKSSKLSWVTSRSMRART